MRVLRWLPAVAAILVLTACGGGGPAVTGGVPSTSGPPAVGKGVIVLIRGDNLWSTHADGSPGDVQLTHEANSDFANNPAVSPDGRMIAYARHVAPSGSNWGGSELHVMNVDGGDDKLLVPIKSKGERAENPAWAPDGKSVYFSHDVPTIDKNNNYVGDTLTLDRVELAAGAVSTVVKNAMFPSASGSQMVWEIYDSATSKFQLQVGGLDGSGARTILSDKDFQAILNPRMSPSGKQILFSGSGRTNSKVDVGAALGIILNPLVPQTASAHGLPWDLWIIGSDGHDLRKLVSIGSDEQAIAWSPDGQTIAFANLSATYLARADGSGVTRLFTHGDPGGLDWVP